MTTPIPLDEGDDGRPLLPPTPQGLPALVDEMEATAKAQGETARLKAKVSYWRAMTEDANAEVERLRDWLADARAALRNMDRLLTEVNSDADRSDRADAAEATLARVRALADSIQQPGAWVSADDDSPAVWVTHLRAALDGYRIEFSTAKCAYVRVALTETILDAPAAPPSVHADATEAPPATVETPEPREAVSGDESGHCCEHPKCPGGSLCCCQPGGAR